MNYRHIFHAGNRCDVVKHAVLALILEYLRTKNKGFVVLDTHGGAGLYNINDPRSLRTAEAQEGILTLLRQPPIPFLKNYTAILKKLNPLWPGVGTEHFRVYPGSPLISYHMLRDQDRLIVCELHPEDAAALASNSPSDTKIQIHHRNGYEAMNAFLPPPEKRGLVLIDPPYEMPDEFATLFLHVINAYRQWPTGHYMIWYPIKDRAAIWKFHEAFANSAIKKVLCAEFIFEEDIPSDRLRGSGLILINPPWKFEDNLKTLFSDLHDRLQSSSQLTKIMWLSQEI